MSFVEFENVAKTYHMGEVTIQALHDATFHVERGELGVKSGSGFYDYSHRPYAETLRKRDEQLVKSVALAKECMDDPLHKR